MPLRNAPSAELAQLLLAVAENISLAVWAVDKDLSLIWSNTFFKERLGESFAVQELWRPLYRRAFEAHQPVHGDDTIEVNGAVRHFALSIYPVANHLAVLCRETTTQMKLYSANEQLQREVDDRVWSEKVRATIQQHMLLADRLTSVGTLAAGVAHEINNPLAAILVNLQLAQEDVQVVAEKGATPEMIEHLRDELRDAVAACDRVKSIVKDLKVFARNSERESNGPVNLQQVLELSMRMANAEIRHRARLIRKLEPVGAVHGNEARLGQLFLNLLLNAAQAIEPGNADEHQIRVSTRAAKDGFAEVEISDTGHGITPENLPRIFDPFFSTRPTGEGVGLGLSIANQIVTSLGGTIAVQTEPGKGSSFTVTLPTVKVVELVPRSAVDTISERTRGKVLSIDDEPMVGTFVSRVLGGQHEVETAVSAAEALARIRAGRRYDVILCDVMMPQMTGFDLYWTLAREVPEQAKRMVFLTAGAFTSQARSFFEMTTNPRLEKPFDATALRHLVSRCISTAKD